MGGGHGGSGIGVGMGEVGWGVPVQAGPNDTGLCAGGVGTHEAAPSFGGCGALPHE